MIEKEDEPHRITAIVFVCGMIRGRRARISQPQVSLSGEWYAQLV